jgi:tRNA pseudouridine55 synthase
MWCNAKSNDVQWQLPVVRCQLYKGIMHNGQRTTDNGQLVDGILVIDKPADWTSHDVVAKVRKLCRTRRVGHTGTLDPFATGVLVVCLNRATRLVQFLTGEDKEYLATIRFGFATDTGDLTGAPLAPPAATAHLNEALIESALAQLRERRTQIPPMYSAKKVGGVKLYEMARRGEEIERPPISIEIKKLSLVTPLQDDECRVQVVCSSGTYIRTLAEDIGKQLGIGAHLTALRRTRAGRCELAQAITLEQLAQSAEAGRWEESVMPMTLALDLPALELDEREREMISHGRTIRYPGQWATGQQVKLTQAQHLIAIAEYEAEAHVLRPRVVF